MTWRVAKRILATWLIGFVVPVVIMRLMSESWETDMAHVVDLALATAALSVVAIVLIFIFWFIEKLMLSLGAARWSSISGLILVTPLYPLLLTVFDRVTALQLAAAVFLPAIVWLISFFLSKRTIEIDVDNILS